MNTHKLWNKLEPSPAFKAALYDKLHQKQPTPLVSKVAIGALALCMVLVIGVNEWHKKYDPKKINDMELYEEYMESDQVADMLLVH